MTLRQVVHYKGLEHDKPVVERLVAENLSGKLDVYLRKFKEAPENSLELWLESKDNRFNGKLSIKVGGKDWRYSREGYRKLDDLVNHLFDHLKADFSGEPTAREADLRRVKSLTADETVAYRAA